MGPNKTAITLTGGPRVISVFDVHGCHRVQIKHFFGMQTGSRTPYGLGLIVGGRLHRLRMRLELSRELWNHNLRDLDSSQMAGQGLNDLYVTLEVPAYAMQAIAHVY